MKTFFLYLCSLVLVAGISAFRTHSDLKNSIYAEHKTLPIGSKAPAFQLARNGWKELFAGFF